MTTAKDSRRRLMLLIAAGIVLLVALVLAVSALADRGTNSPADVSLRRTANHLLPTLNYPRGPLPIRDQTLVSFQAWVADTHVAFNQARKALPHGQSIQVQLFDPSVMPPQAIAITEPSHSLVVLDSNFLGSVVTSSAGRFTSVQVNGRTVRVYALALGVPQALRLDNASAVLAVIGS